jgi:hypothetical protein
MFKANFWKNLKFFAELDKNQFFQVIMADFLVNFYFISLSGLYIA